MTVITLHQTGSPETWCGRPNEKLVDKVSKYDMKFVPRGGIKGQVLVDFIVEFNAPIDMS